MSRPRKLAAREKERIENPTMLQAWKRWHRDELESALQGTHRGVLERLMMELKDLRSARKLVLFIGTQDWTAVDYPTRLIVLREVNEAIT
jgi:hypothetical protein